MFTTLRIKLGVACLRLGHWLIGQNVRIHYSAGPVPNLEQLLQDMTEQHRHGEQ